MVTTWVEKTHTEGALLRGMLLEEAQAWGKTRGADLSEQEQAFVAASQTVAERETREREAARQRELTLERSRMEAERRRAEDQLLANRQLRRRALWLATALLLAVVVAGVAIYYFDQADKQRRRAEDNATLANQKLAELAGEQLLKEARTLKTAGQWAEALAKLEEADQLALRPDFDLPTEKADVTRQAAIALVRAGEELARQGDVPGATAKYQAALDLNPPSDTPVYVRVPAGPFQMGSNDGGDDEKPQHEVTLDEFWILRTEVTNGQYQECMAAKSCDAPIGLRANSSKLDNWPVVNVTWQQAQQYATWKGGRLPTEAEWEKACRGTEAVTYPWGDEPPTAERTNYDFNEAAWTIVGSYPPGTYGLFDMAGNVWEWTASKYAAYPYKVDEGREANIGYKDRVSLRGGSIGFSEYYLRCALRYTLYRSERNDFVGFRVVSPGF